ncbi:MAG TPA: FKBP-type peptidyl-prolyl cis-trans isomerase [Paludibacteraceae bacterium]|jgi:FKBP-type peptidyl-prolyl cis-trans isomerase FklB|nr:FKBP-type peptidyl-prolyl cis-trans isomerase [Paludibacteraceae bacterium]
MDKLSYALGLSFGQSLRQNDIKGIDYESFAKGIKAMCEGTRPELSVQEAQELLNDYFAQKEAEKEKASAGIRKESDDFLAKNAKRSEVTITESGLQYEVITEGKGDKPTASDRVKVHYHGTLINGTVFDSSVMRNEPATFGVTQVIAGWVEALQLMSVGSKWKLYIPSNLAYGAHGAGDAIKPHSALIFEVELLDIIK